MTNTQILSSLLLYGLLGLIGQGIRAIVGLGGGVNASSSAANQQSAFNAAYLLFTLMIGFIAGVLAGLAAFDQIATALNFKMALGVMAAGYAGADFIENTFTGLLGSLGVGRAPAQPASQPAGPQPAEPQPTTPTTGPVTQPAAQPQKIAPRAEAPSAAPASDAMAERLADAESRLTRLEAIAAPAPADLIPNADDAITRVTFDMVCQMFPATRRAPIARNLPFVLAGLQGVELTDKAMVCMALGTIRAETEGFVPIPEGVSRFNTERTPFDLYEPGTPAGRRLGNTQPGDGARYKAAASSN
jgi:putative chitinase